MDTEHYRTLGIHATVEFYEMIKFIAHELHHTSISKYVTDLITKGMDDKDIDLYKYQKKSERISP